MSEILKTRADLMDELASQRTGMLCQRLSVKLGVADAIKVREALTNAIAEGHARYTCIPCRDAAHHEARGQALQELRWTYLDKAGKLFANSQDNEAKYLRDTIANGDLAERIGEQHEAAIASLNTKLHLCTLHGDRPAV